MARLIPPRCPRCPAVGYAWGLRGDHRGALPRRGSGVSAAPRLPRCGHVLAVPQHRPRPRRALAQHQPTHVPPGLAHARGPRPSARTWRGAGARLCAGFCAGLCACFGALFCARFCAKSTPRTLPALGKNAWSELPDLAPYPCPARAMTGLRPLQNACSTSENPF